MKPFKTINFMDAFSARFALNLCAKTTVPVLLIGIASSLTLSAFGAVQPAPKAPHLIQAATLPYCRPVLAQARFHFEMAENSITVLDRKWDDLPIIEVSFKKEKLYSVEQIHNDAYAEAETRTRDMKDQSGLKSYVLDQYVRSIFFQNHFSEEEVAKFRFVFSGDFSKLFLRGPNEIRVYTVYDRKLIDTIVIGFPEPSAELDYQVILGEYLKHFYDVDPRTARP
jgi:hypothetical protein